MFKLILRVGFLFVLALRLEMVFSQQIIQHITSGDTWVDMDGKPIEAHGGGILQVGDTYYWYGENHALGVGNKTGINCYSSKDLLRWKSEGVVFPKSELPTMFQDSGVCERPKVLYNEKTRKYVMWMHLDADEYTVAMAGVAISNYPAGPFKFLGSKRPIKYDYGYKKEPRVANKDSREKELGNTFRDFNLLKDEDGEAYLFYSSEELATQYVVRLNEEYTDIELPAIKGKSWERVMVGMFREAPAPFKFQGKYYLITSGTSGWDPNPAELAYAENIFGPWKTLGNPCIGPEYETTFQSQSTFVLQAPGKPPGSFIYMGDRWNGQALEKSRYVWLPFVMNEAGGFRLVNIPKWDLSIFDRIENSLNAPVIKEKTAGEIVWRGVSGADGYMVFKNGLLVSFLNDTVFAIPNEFAGQVFNYTVQSWKLTGEASRPSNSLTKNWTDAADLYLGDMNAETFVQGWGNLQKDRSIKGEINIAGKAFKKGIGTHANSEVVYRICGNYKRFTAWTGVDYFTHFNSTASVQFEVYGDGLLLYRGKKMKVSDPAVFVDLKITGINELKLVVNDAGDGQDWDHANWAEAKIEK